jgi:hypothetical protein
MKVMFVENREKTLFWEHIGAWLTACGATVSWIVQNPLFSPASHDPASARRIHRLPFPRQQDLDRSVDTAWISTHFPLLERDRGRVYFESGGAHYPHYARHIAAALDTEQPDLVVGEATLFHELLTVDLCRQRQIAFVQPASNRYPSGRFLLFGHDSQVPLLASGLQWPDADALDLADRIATSREIPFYMQRPGRLQRWAKKGHWALTRSRVLAGRLAGDTYNTPSLSRKWALQRNVTGWLRRWGEVASLPPLPERALLYPMQLQPEANIDVWGRPYSDQLALIQELLTATPADVHIAVKANPKAKYELCDALFDLATREPRLCLLPMTMSMPQAQALSTGAITVTGTVGLEAITGKGRALSLRHPIIEREFPQFHAASPTEAAVRLLQDPQAGRGNTALGARLIQTLVSESFPGLVADPFSYPMAIAPDNIEAVAGPLLTLLQRCAAAQASRLSRWQPKQLHEAAAS